MVKTIVIMIDAFRRDYLNEENTPFLYSLAKKFGFGKLTQPFGFKTATGFFTGLHPKKINQFVNYKYDKDSKKINPFLFFLLKLFPKPLNFHILNFLKHLKGEDMFFPTINIDYLKYFTLSQNKHFYQKNSLPVKNIFDIFRENKIRYLFYDFPPIIENGKSRLHFTLKNNDNIRVKKFLKLLSKNYDFYYLHLVDLDPVGHYHGTDSIEIKKTLKKTDDFVKIILSKFDLEKDNILLWSDHGMVEIKNIIDLKSKLPKFGEDYFYFLDSTMARFWFFNQNKKQEVLSILKNYKQGKLLSDNDKQKLKIDFDHNLYGEEIFLANSGTLIYPNFFNPHPVKAMHGYDLSNENEKTFFMINKKNKNQGKTEDLFPTLLELMKLNFNKNIDGKSLLES